jgi:hypothetical protein
MRLLITLALLACAHQAEAQTVYKCKDAKGQTSFQHQPCDGEGRGAIDVTPANVVDGRPQGDRGTRAEAVRKAEVRAAQARGELSPHMTYSEAITTLRGPAGPVSVGGSSVSSSRSNKYAPVLVPCYSDLEIRNATLDASSVTKSEDQKRQARIRERVMRNCYK